MTLGCGSKFAKFILVLVNVLISLLSIAMIAVGIYVLVMVKTASNSGEWYGVQFGALQAAAGMLIGVGIAIFFICLFGCCGAIKENTGCLIFYAVVVFILVVIQLVAFIMAVVFYSKINSGLHDSMTNSLSKNYTTNPNDPITQSWDYMQKEFHCCGVDSPLDWKSSEWKKNTSKNVPTSCCVMNSTGLPVSESKCQTAAYFPNNTAAGSDYVYYQGCLMKVENSSKTPLLWFIGVVLAIILLQVLVGIMACCLKSSINKSYEKV